MNAKTADVIIVGGGIMGASSAFFLRQQGLSVILLERGLVGQQASGTNFGNVRRQARVLHQLPLSNRALRVWERLPELIGEDVEFIQQGHVRFAFSDDQVGKLEEYARGARDYELDLDILSRAEVLARYPFMSPNVVGASLSPRDGHANPRLSAPAFARAATRAGARIIENTEVLDVGKDGTDFRAVCADGSEYRAPNMLVTAGAWAGRLCAQFNEPVPLYAAGPQMGVTEPLRYKIAPSVGICTSEPTESIYFRQVKRGNIVFGGCLRNNDIDVEGRRAYVKPEITLHQFRQLVRVCPGLEQMNIIRVWSGIESYLPDALPVMGPSATVPGLYYSFGFNGYGFQLGPGVGEVMAELIATGSTSTPLAPYHMQRFAQQAVTV